jgi:hypothetical protein
MLKYRIGKLFKFLVIRKWKKKKQLQMNDKWLVLTKATELLF